MSFFVYVSHKDPVHALIAVRSLMENGHLPFMPALNKLIPGRTDKEWENYFMMYLLRMDAMLMTESYREHEKNWAIVNDIPVCASVREVNDLKLPPFRDLGKEFGETIVKLLSKKEAWRKKTLEEVQKEYSDMVGLGRPPEVVAAKALELWDRRRRN